MEILRKEKEPIKTWKNYMQKKLKKCHGKDDTCFFCAHNCRDQFLGVSDLALAGHQLSSNPALKGQCLSMLVPSF